MSSAGPALVACPACAAINRVPAGRPAQAAKCGRCQAPLFAGRPVALNARNFDAHAVRADIPLLVDFWAAWCGPCRTMGPAFERAATSLEPRMRLGKVDVDAEPELARRFGIQGIPALVLIRDGREVARRTGAAPGQELIRWAEAHM